MTGSAPIITEGDEVSIRVSASAQNPVFNLTLNATDTNQDTLTWRIETNGTQGIAETSGTGNSKVISYTPNINASNDSFIVEVSDGELTDLITVTVTVFILDSNTNVVSDRDDNNNGITDKVEAAFGTDDTDADSIPDELERFLGRDVSVSTDTDGDGMPDVGEVMIGRDPNTNDNLITSSPMIIIATTPLNLAAKGTLSAYNTAELGVSATDESMTVTPEAYLKNGACSNAVPYNYQVVCNKVPNSGYSSGANNLWWLFTDTAGNWGRNEQTLNILPQVSFESASLILSGDANTGSVTTRLILTGDTVSGAAFSIPFTLSGSAQNPFDHNLVAGQFQFQPNALSSDPVTITLGNTPTDGSDLIVTLDSTSTVFVQPDVDIDIEVQFVTTGITLSQLIMIAQNRAFAPRLANFKGTQGTNRGRLFDKTKGNVTLSFDINDPDGGNYSFSWLNSSNTLLLASGNPLTASTTATPVLDISTLPIGRYFIEGAVTDSETSIVSRISGILTIVGGLTLSSTVDTDKDGIVDSVEGTGDSDGDGIPNYLDAQNNQANVVPSDGNNINNFLVRTQPGLRVLFGTTATAASKGGITITLADLASKGDNGQSTTNSDLPNMTLSRIFDYEIEGVTVPVDPNDQGNSVSIILPLVTALSADSDFFKYDANGWHQFTEDANNHIEWSAFEAGIRGNCPEITSPAYNRDASQKAGKHCIKLTIQDGGANDADGVVDGRIVDPLGIARPSEAPQNVIGSGGGGSFDWFVLWLLSVLSIVQRLMMFNQTKCHEIKGLH